VTGTLAILGASGLTWALYEGALRGMRWRTQGRDPAPDANIEATTNEEAPA
jgi:hypothetical protein